MVLKANDRRTSCPCHDEFRGPRSDYVRRVALATTTTRLVSKSSIAMNVRWHRFQCSTNIAMYPIVYYFLRPEWDSYCMCRRYRHPKGSNRTRLSSFEIFPTN
ncbi:hypothetical protein TNCV_1389121 [Trichonephila clavipes]|nr:hypothetical protein TNCV_1389121 [Trichonephila clavipes]